jgi:hypothetical protein
MMMFNRILIFLFFISTTITFAQKLNYAGNGNILDSNSNKLTPEQVEILLKDNDDLLRSYVAGRSKKSVGNIMLYGGLGLIATDLLIGATADKEYPTFFTIIGGITTLIAIPVKMGYSKKIKNVINDYNAKNGFTYKSTSDAKLDFISNNAGLGMRLTFN